MNRREMIALSGAALAASEGMVRAQQSSITMGVAQHAKVAKTLVKYNRTKQSYHIPKSGTKATAYVAKLAGALSLSDSQQKQAADIFTSAASTRTNLQAGLRSAHKAVSDAVVANDQARIGQAAAAIAGIKAQLVVAGATAHSGFYRLLTPDQQDTLAKFRG